MDGSSGSSSGSGGSGGMGDVDDWIALQAAPTPTLLPSLKFHDLVFGQELGVFLLPYSILTLTLSLPSLTLA